jgi:hypothetical protein
MILLLKIVKTFPQKFFLIFVDFSKFCRTYGSLHFEKSTNMEKFWGETSLKILINDI